MLRSRFRAVELSFGRHQREWALPEHDRPVVIAGSNGSGKTTLVEGLVRTLFGYDRRRSADASELESRRPWDGATASGRVQLVAADRSVTVQRDFGTGHVRVLSEGVEQFRGDGNPGARNQEARHYRRILADLLGLPDLSAYHSTLFVRQGALPDAGLDDHLLRVAAGGHARVDAARREVAEAHRRITRRPIHPGAHGAINPRELEKVEEEAASVQRRLESARQAGERRGPLALERDRTAERLAGLDEEIRLLEEAQAGLARTRMVEVESRQLRDLARKLDRAAVVVAAAEQARTAARSARDDATAGGHYPPDFRERIARADLLWRDTEQLDDRLSVRALLVGLLLTGVAVALWLLDQSLTLAQVTATLGGLALAAALALFVDRRRRRARARAELGHVLKGVPGSEGLSPATRDKALSRFRAQQDAERRLAQARQRLAEALRGARSLLRDARALGLELPPGSTREPERAVRAVVAEARERLARGRNDLEKAGESSLELPDGVVPTEQGVRDALRDRRTERGRVQETLQSVTQELLERGTPAESPDALESELSALVPRREALNRKARVLESAHALIADAFDSFRDRDQERLVGMVSQRAQRLTDRLGPVVVSEDLQDARVRSQGRLLDLTSPPLSWGEYHALLLAVRLGAADFLAGVGVAPPLLIDEPFAHLDRARARALWRLLCSVARDRQVIITTQDELLLRDLGAQPDILLA